MRNTIIATIIALVLLTIITTIPIQISFYCSTGGYIGKKCAIHQYSNVIKMCPKINSVTTCVNTFDWFGNRVTIEYVSIIDNVIDSKIDSVSKAEYNKGLVKFEQVKQCME